MKNAIVENMAYAHEHGTDRKSRSGCGPTNAIGPTPKGNSQRPDVVWALALGSSDIWALEFENEEHVYGPRVFTRTAATASPTRAEMDQLCVNTIRTLSMDAVQEANSGHPEPRWRSRRWHAASGSASCGSIGIDLAEPRSVRPVGRACLDASCSMLHLTGVRAVNPKYETLGHPSVTLDDIKRFRQLGSRCPGHPDTLDVGRRDDHRTPRAGAGDECRHGDRREVAGELLQPAGVRPVRLRRLRAVRRRLHDGRHLRRSGLAGRPPALGNLCWIYDNNHITIEGNTALAYSDDVATRFIGTAGT